MSGIWMISVLLLWFVPGVCWLWERGAFEGFSRRTSNRKLLLFAPFFLLLLVYAQKPQNQPEVTLPSRQQLVVTNTPAMQMSQQSGELMSAELKLSGVVPVSYTNSTWSAWTNGTVYEPWVTVPIRKAVAELELPFAFPVGTNVYSNIYVSASGVIGFDRPRGSVVPAALPCAYGTNGVFLALAWGDNMFKPGQGSRLYYGIESNSFCMLMDDVFAGTNMFSAKAELFDNGTIVLKYRNLPADHTIGLQNFSGGWQVATNGTFELFCRYFGWLSLDQADTDADGLSDYDELYVHHTDPHNEDSDGDGVLDGAEVWIHGSSPLCVDSDGDGAPDGWEVSRGYDPTVWDLADTDGDGVYDYLEEVYGTNPLMVDTDGDGLNDWDELFVYGTDPLNVDSDDDGLSDGNEVSVYETDPLCADTDGDTIPDGWEVEHGYFPRIWDAMDSDNDELYDYWEEVHGTNPLVSDTDADGMCDGWEVRYGFDPLVKDSDGDTDGDGLSELEEFLSGTSPTGADTDGDGVSDDEEIRGGSNPLDASDGGIPPNREEMSELTFTVGGDYASWVMKIEKLGTFESPLYVSTARTGETKSKKFWLRQGGSYRITLQHRDSVQDARAPWYCWSAQIDGYPSGRTYNDYSPIRLPGEEIVVGAGWVAQNTGGLLTPHVHMNAGYGGNVAGSLSATLTVLRIRMVTPGGDPVVYPNDYGTGQNEFTFTGGTPALLQMNLVASVYPSGFVDLIADQVQFWVDDIPGSAIVWHYTNPDGQAVASGDRLSATVTYLGMPTENAAFGRKTVAVAMRGKRVSETPYEVFFEKYANNHPPCTTCAGCPNWYYYWRQTCANGANTTMQYINVSRSAYYYDSNRTIGIGNDAATAKNVSEWGNPSGIDCFAWVTRHEAKHHTQITGFWPAFRNLANDLDDDWIPDSLEGTYMPGRPYSPTKQKTYPDGVGYGEDPIRDIEDICMRTQIFPYQNLDILWTNGQANQVDWARPGKNSISRY